MAHLAASFAKICPRATIGTAALRAAVLTSTLPLNLLLTGP